VDAAAAREALAASRRAALVAAAALIGPAAPPGKVDRHPDQAATATIRIAEMFLPWLEGVPAAREVRQAKALAAATAATADPATGVDDHGSTRPGPEED
jgi:pimeloyl-ACP methyl ester carboxylesterase